MQEGERKIQVARMEAMVCLEKEEKKREKEREEVSCDGDCEGRGKSNRGLLQRPEVRITVILYCRGFGEADRGKEARDPIRERRKERHITARQLNSTKFIPEEIGP